MKRFNKTAVALATAGAMTLAVVPNASAQVLDPEHPNEDYLKNDQPFTFDGEGENATANPGDDAIEVPNEDVPRRLGETPGDVTVTEDGEGNRTTNTAPTPAEEKPSENRPVTLKKGDTVKDKDGNVQLVAESDGELAVLMPGDRVIDANKVDVTTIRGGKVEATDPKGPETESKGGAWGALAAAAAAGLILPLLIGKFKAVNDAEGNPVLVPADRADQTPTAEDKAKTEQLVAEHGDEIVAKAAEAGVADNGATADRGVSAATGNNSIAKGLVGLLLASIMGAAAFAFGRRRLV